MCIEVFEDILSHWINPNQYMYTVVLFISLILSTYQLIARELMFLKFLKMIWLLCKQYTKTLMYESSSRAFWNSWIMIHSSFSYIQILLGDTIRSTLLMFTMNTSTIVNYSLIQKSHQLHKFNGIPKENFYLYIKECEWLFNFGNPKRLLKILPMG